MSSTNKSTSWLWTRSLWIFWDGNGFFMPWCYTLEQQRMRVTLWCTLFLKTSPRKATFLLYKRKPTNLLVSDVS